MFKSSDSNDDDHVSIKKLMNLQMTLLGSAKQVIAKISEPE